LGTLSSITGVNLKSGQTLKGHNSNLILEKIKILKCSKFLFVFIFNIINLGVWTQGLARTKIIRQYSIYHSVAYEILIPNVYILYDPVSYQWQFKKPAKLLIAWTIYFSLFSSEKYTDCIHRFLGPLASIDFCNHYQFNMKILMFILAMN